MKIKLINPGQLTPEGKPVRLHKEFCPGLTLPYLAALFPAGHKIEIIEEGLKQLNYDEPVDLVGITAMTSRAPRAYQIADHFKKRGVPVVMGGFHVSALPEEALRHCDAIVQGEAEGLIEKILADTRAGRLQGIYKKKHPVELHGLPCPRYELLNMNNYLFPIYPVQATRGCPYQCDFCSVSTFYGRKQRKRPIGDVIHDIKKAGRFVLIVDDNLCADRKYAITLFKQMKSLNKLWGGQSNLSTAADPELVKSAAESGCMFLYLGMESMDPDNLQTCGKPLNQEVSATKAIRYLKRHHIEPFISMIVGFDHDDCHTGKKIAQFCNQFRIPLLLLYILTPLPGSPLYSRLAERGKILNKNWHLYDGTHALFHPQNMRPRELQNMYAMIHQNVYALPSIFRRVSFPPHLLILCLNLIFRQDLKNSLHPWMGTKLKTNMVDRIAPTLITVLSRPALKKVSKIVRFAEGRFIN